MKFQTRDIQAFFSSQNFTDGLRVTVGVLLPSLVLAQFDLLKFGFLMSLGALTVSITDIPGPEQHKRNGMLLCCLTVFLVSLLTGLVRENVWLLGGFITFCCFFFSMLPVYGNRAGALGVAAILVMIVTMGQPLENANLLLFSSLILGGGLWYTLLSLLLHGVRPYRAVQQQLGECVMEVARFLHLKAGFYDVHADLDEAYRKLVAQQVVVNEKQEAVREVLFKSRQLVKDSTNISRVLLLTFVNLIDLYEQITAIQYDYAELRSKYKNTDLLQDFSRFITRMADELENIGLAIQANKPYVLPQELQQAQQQLAAKTEAAGAGTAELKKVLQNINNLMQRLQDISRYFNAKQISKSELPKEPEFMRFVSHQEISFQTFRNNLSRSSSIFKHAVRVAVACLFGFVLTQILPYGEHSYWVLLTIIVILKPAFSLTKQRNIQRLSGTLAGAVIGVLILLLIPDKTIQFVLLVLFMLITFSFIRVNYIVSVLFMTPFILIIFNFLGAGGFDLVQERIIDTLLGSAIAFAASYVIFPSWEREQLQSLMRTAVDANLHYLQKVAERLQGQQVNEYDYKLARKEVYVSSANLSAAFQRMLSEPKSKQQNSSQVHRFVVLNHVLSANIATVASAVLRSDTKVFQPQLLQLTEQVLAVLQQTLQKLNNAPEPNQTPTQPEMMDTKLLNETEKQLAEQLSFICKVSSDLRATAV